MSIRVLIAGTGFAGKGHTEAFRAAGADVVGMVRRTEHMVRDVTAATASWPVSALFKHGGLVPRFNGDHVTIFGTRGVHYQQIIDVLRRSDTRTQALQPA